MKKIANVLILFGGLILLGVGIFLDLKLKTQTPPPLWGEWGAKVVNAVGLGVIIAIVSTKVRDWVTSALEERGPKTTIITADERCKQLTRSVQENPTARLFTTRYSARGIGTTVKSKGYLAALDTRIHLSEADTFRVITLDHDDKVKSAMEMLKKHYSNPHFGLKVLVPTNLRLIDLIVSEGHFACLGIETRNPDENYWIRIDDPQIANEFRNYYEKDHWGRPEAVEIKGPGVILNETGLKAAEQRLLSEASRAGLATQSLVGV